MRFCARLQIVHAGIAHNVSDFGDLATMKISALFASIALAGGAARAGGQSSPPVVSRWDRDSLLGCYQILDAKLRPADGAWYNVMSLVRLTDTPMRDMKGTILPRAWHLRPLSDARHGRWKADPRGLLDSLPIAPEWSLNLSGDSANFNTFSVRLHASNDRSAAVDDDGLSRDVTSRIGREQQSCTHQIGITTELPERRLAKSLRAVSLECRGGHL